MTNKKTLIVGPPKKIYENIIKDPRFIIYLNWQFSFYDPNSDQVTSISISDLKIDNSESIFSDDDRIWILKMTDVTERWSRGNFNLSIERDDFLLNMIKIRIFLKNNFVNKAIFYTSAPHHIDTSILSASLSFLKIPEYYLDFQKFVGETFLIIKGSNLFSKRQMPFEKLTDYRSDEDLNLLISKKLNKDLLERKNFIHRSYIEKLSWYQKNFYISLIISIFQLIKFKFRLNIHKYSSSNISLKRVLSDMFAQRAFLKYYRKINDYNKFSIVNINSHQPKIIIAASYQPEVSTAPLGGRFVSHIDLILKLRSVGYRKNIYYKEHPDSQLYTRTKIGPTGVGGYRSISYLKTLMSLGVKFLPYNIYLSTLSDCWIVTISGHIAIERSLLGLQTIVAGNPWYEGLPGTISINQVTLDQLKKKPNLECHNLKVSAKDFLKKTLDNICLPKLYGNNEKTNIDLHCHFLNNMCKNNIFIKDINVNN
jgi:hypothetical protein